MIKPYSLVMHFCTLPRNLFKSLATVFVFFNLLFFISSSFAVVETYEFDSEATRERYQVFIQELRCPKCQNQNLSGSDSAIAADLRRELYRLLEEGRSDDEIVDFMVSRYGQYILYKPRVNTSTYLLWFAPAVMLLLGIVVLMVIVRRRIRQQQSEGVGVGHDVELSKEEEARLAALLQSKREQSKQDAE